MTKAEAKRVIDEIRSEAKDFPEMSLDEINEEINAVRSKKQGDWIDMTYYAVFDTNVLVSSLLTKNPDVATARVIYEIASQRIIPIGKQRLEIYHQSLPPRIKYSMIETIATPSVIAVKR